MENQDKGILAEDGPERAGIIRVRGSLKNLIRYEVAAYWRGRSCYTDIVEVAKSELYKGESRVKPRQQIKGMADSHGVLDSETC